MICPGVSLLGNDLGSVLYSGEQDHYACVYTMLLNRSFTYT